MRNIARLSENDRQELFRNTADKMGLNDAIVEKTFGYALHWIIFSTAVRGKMQSPLRAVPVYQKPLI